MENLMERVLKFLEDNRGYTGEEPPSDPNDDLDFASFTIHADGSGHITWSCVEDYDEEENTSFENIEELELILNAEELVPDKETDEDDCGSKNKI